MARRVGWGRRVLGRVVGGFVGVKVGGAPTDSEGVDALFVVVGNQSFEPLPRTRCSKDAMIRDLGYEAKMSKVMSGVSSTSLSEENEATGDGGDGAKGKEIGAERVDGAGDGGDLIAWR